MRTLALALAATLLPIGVAGPAVAEKATHHDGRYDVVVLESSSPCDSCPPPTAVEPPYSPLLRRLDIRQLIVEYRRSELRLTIQARLLGEDTTLERVFAHWRLKGADGQDWEVSLGRGFSVGDPEVIVGFSQDGEARPCPGLKGKFLVSHKAWKVIIPAGCLGTSRWVRAGGQLSHIDHLTFAQTIDDALTREPEDASLEARLGPRVHRG
jgi:hypothetical protein